ncbi:8166_t:CDS:2, partial [Acaulospora morrowiae]
LLISGSETILDGSGIEVTEEFDFSRRVFNCSRRDKRYTKSRLLTNIIEKRSAANHVLIVMENYALKSKPLNIRNDNVANAYSKGTSSERLKNLKRIENALVECIDEKVLGQENILPQISGNSVSMDQRKNIDAGIVESFYEYQKTIPKSLSHIEEF